MTAVTLNAHDQLLLELINRARADPGAEAARYGINLNAGLASGSISYAAKQPLAPNQALQNAAGAHSADMLANNYFSHTSLTGQSPSARAAAAGYPTWVGENISWGGTTGSVNQIDHVYQRHRSLFESPGHRQNLMNAAYEEIGVGVRFGPYTYSNGVTYNSSMVTEKFGRPGIDPIITGVVYTDAADGSASDDSFYSVGEQVTSGSITAINIHTGAQTTTEIGASGGFSLPVAAGTYNVVAVSGVDGVTYLAANVVVTGFNVKVDFETTTAAMVNHAPVLASLSDITLFLEQTEVHVTLAATDADGDALSYTVTVENLAAHLNETLGLTTTQSVPQNWGGMGEKWLAGNGETLYYVTPSGQLFEWTDGGPANLSGRLIASLDSSFHQNVELLTSASAGIVGVTASIDGDELSVVTASQNDNTFVVKIAVSDGVDVTETSFRVAKGHQFSRSLDQDLGLFTDGDFRENWGGLQEKWVLGAGGLQYFITPDGQFFRHNGSPANNLSGTFIAQLDTAQFERPSLLIDAEMFYLDVALDLHNDSSLADDSVAAWLPLAATVEHSRTIENRPNISRLPVHWATAGDWPLAGAIGLDGRTTSGVVDIQAISTTSDPLSAAHSKHDSTLVDALTSAMPESLTDEIFADWNRDSVISLFS